ncbi:hypothetical protein Leucomu_05415 [Leucobacter muris]|uniref:Uncharacterized protein n=1 Tax=Leucobacter muris TaxID=1935379 RepID=A0ABX5QEC8_9MICO|nr:hypothetical protein Leucomu_05415 [Leucobacter muris]
MPRRRPSARRTRRPDPPPPASNLRRTAPRSCPAPYAAVRGAHTTRRNRCPSRRPTRGPRSASSSPAPAS